MIIKKEHESKVKQLFSMASAGPAEKEIIKELTNEYLGPAQVAVTCWTCPASISNVYKMLTTALTGYEVEKEKPITPISKDENNGPSGPANSKRNKK